LSYAQSPTGTRTAILSSSLITTDSSYTYNFPNKGGTFAMTSDVTGAVSGTTNYIPKFTSSSAIGNSVIYELSGNIGLGTTNPSDNIGYGRALDIQSSTGAAVYLRDSDATTTQYAFVAYDGNDNGLKINNQNSSGFIRFSPNGTEGMRLTSTGLGIGTSSPATPLAIKGSANNTLIEMGNSSTNSAFIQAYDRTASLFRPFINYAEYFAWEAGGSEQMRLTSTGLGIGTSSPAYKLDVSGDINISDGNALRGGGQIIARRTGNEIRYGSGTAADYLVFYSGAAERMRLDASGNLGLSVTPSAWSSNNRVLEIGGPENGYIAFNPTNLQSYIYWNDYYDTDNRYKKSSQKAAAF
jgi:hypothetical protein